MNNDRFKFRVWSTKHNCYQEYCSFDLTMEGRLIDGAGNTENNGREDLIIEQCTGLKDKNGNLIYECDLLEAGGRRYVVCWAHHGFVMRFTPDSASSYPLGGTDLFEIIGNIHEQKEEKRNERSK